jgi:hypothetical protein
MSNHIYISLGHNCAPRIYIKDDLKISKILGYKTCPFDLCITNFDSLCNCLNTDFKYFFDDLRLISGCNAPGNRSNCGVGGMNITNTYNIIFNHEGSTHSHLFDVGKDDDNFFIRNDFDEFKKRYIQRINNFNNYINMYNNITFIYNKCIGDNYDNIKLLKLLNDKYKNKNVNILEL